MNKYGINLDFLRDKVINYAIISISILILPVVLFSTIRLFNYGWENYFSIYVFELLFILFLFFSRKKFSLKFKAHSVAVVSVAFGLIGTSIFSLSGGNIQSIIGILIITILFGWKVGIFYLIASITGYSIIGILILNGYIERTMDFNVFNYSLYPWLNAITLYSVIGLLIVYSIGLFYKYILGSLKEVMETKEKLTLVNNELSEHRIDLENKNLILSRLNKEYLENQIKFKTIFDIVEVGISITDEEGKIIDCNDASDKILGISRDEHLNMDLNSTDWNVVHADNTPMKNEDLPGVWALKNKEPLSNVIMGFARKDRDFIWLNVDVIPLNIEGYGVVVTFSDITESKKSEEKLIKYSKELQIMNSDKDKFIRILAHDLKGPFTSLIGFSSFLLENLKDFDIETIKEHIGIINETSNRTYEMLEDILLWLKSQSGQIVFCPKEINYHEICHEVVSASNLIAKDKNVRLQCSCFEDDRKIFADPNMTKTVLRNLISNAIKFSKPEGEVNIYQEIVEDEMIITVSDNGIGISQENINLIWNPLQSFKTNGTNGEKGTGLGLSICKELVEKQGGRIWVESKLGEGSSFKFSMPLNKKN
ncbi:MAG TPA: hypothetical protein DD434_07310 [Bacteroidales bacterium]|nr:hypothetical protein [Bacteroidales bacterium]